MSIKKFGLSMIAMLLSFNLAVAQATEKSVDNSEYQVTVTNPELSAGTVSGNLDGTNTFDRVWEDGVDSGCAHTTSDSFNDGVSYQVFEFHSPAGQAADLEVALGTLADSVLFVYCSFSPAAPMDMVAGLDDDGGVGLGSAIQPADGLILVANTTYYAVVSGWGPTELGTFDLVLGGDLLFGAADTSVIVPSVPDLSTIDLTVPGDTSIIFSNTGGTIGSLDTCSLASGALFTITAPVTFPANVPVGGGVTVTVVGTAAGTDTLSCSYTDSTGTVDVSFTLQGHMSLGAPTSVPFMSTWALGLMSLLVLFVGLIVVRIRH